VTEAAAGRTSREAWLVVIDMQRVFADPESPWATPGFSDVLANNRALIEAFGDRVVFTRFVSPPSVEGAWVDYYRQWPFALVAADDPIYDLVESLPHAGHPVVSRPTFGKYDEVPGSISDLTDHAPTLVLTGVSTDCCVLSTALAAADAGVHVEVVADACAGLGPEDHQRALAAMSLYAPLISVTSTADVLGEQISA
jgi:nicotinamidase-related amidase